MTSFIGRAEEVDRVGGLLDEYRLVTVTGSGGVGKTRLAAQVARVMAGSFADGVQLVELATVQDQGLVLMAVAGVLGVQQTPGTPVMESLASVLARQQLLLVLDNCEHVVGAAAELCAGLLPLADDVRVLATSREPLGLTGEARYRLGPLATPSDEMTASSGDSAAVMLFADRARQADPGFVLDDQTRPLVGQLVTRLDGMPLAIELAAARVEALGVAQLLDRLDDRFGLLTTGDRTAAVRQRSLAATVNWSYQLLDEAERRVFRRLAIFPGPFTLEAAETVAGSAAGLVVLHLVDCSLLTPPQAGPDGRARYMMLETLRAYGLERLDQYAEQPDAAAALARHAVQIVEQAAAALVTSSGELAAARWLAAEDATVHQGLAWALEGDPATALRMAIALSPWWSVSGRSAEGYKLLSTAAGQAASGTEMWATAQLWLGQISGNTGDMASCLSHCSAVLNAMDSGRPSLTLADAFVGQAIALHNLGLSAEAASAGHRGLAVAREIGYPAGEAAALRVLGLLARRAGDDTSALDWIRQARQIDPLTIPGWVARKILYTVAWFLIEAGDLTTAQVNCAEGLARAREAGDRLAEVICLSLMADLDHRAGHLTEARAHLREALTLAARIGDGETMMDCVDCCGRLCATTQHWVEAVTLWTAYRTLLGKDPALGQDRQEDREARQDQLRKAARVLGPTQMRSAEERGTSMTLATAAELVIMLTDTRTHADQGPDVPPELTGLSSRERELVTLVARGHTDNQIASMLYISVSTVRSHLDRIRDKTSCRRRADLTRLALKARLV